MGRVSRVRDKKQRPHRFIIELRIQAYKAILDEFSLDKVIRRYGSNGSFMFCVTSLKITLFSRF